MPLHVEPMSADRVRATAFFLTPCGFSYRSEAVRLREVGEMLTILAEGAGITNALVMEGDEHLSRAMNVMFAGTKERPSRGVTHLRIGEL